MPLQAQDVCKVCGFHGNNLIQHYVANHPGVETPVHLTTKELSSLKNGSRKPQTGSGGVTNHDKEDLLMEFLNKLGPEATFRSPVECPLCPYSTTSRSDMMNHLLIHQSTHFVCYFCSANETNLNDFRDHVSTHTGEYAYQCIHCTFRGAHSTDVARHITTSHPGKEAKTIFENVAQVDEDTLKGYACSHCGYIQMSKATMEKHVASVDTFCRGSTVIEFDLSRGRSSTRSSIVKGSNNSANAQLAEESQNRVYIQDEIEIEPTEPAPADSILPYNNEEQNREGWNPVLKIKTEKVDAGYGQSVNRSSPVVSSTSSINRSESPTVTHAMAQPTPVSSAQKDSSENGEPSSDAPREPRAFVCASCQFSTKDETEFIKHARTDHRTDLSLWCKSCGKCFSNAGVLVTHIKEGTCEKEEMVYRCGVKECTFETPSGQTFVHHLRHCHKGSPFIFCVHCQKIFTLPHCLILHMQNDCPYKERNRKNPGQVSSEPSASSNSNNSADKVTPAKPATPAIPTVTPGRPILPRPPASNVSQASLTPGRGRSDSRGRGSRGRGRGRGRPKFVDSESESDPDDPSWTPDETPSSRPVRRSARFRRGEDSVDSTPQNENKVKSESVVPSQPRREEFLSHAVTCPSCDFATLSKTLLEDHYVSEHKKLDKNQCKVCSVKFETITSFTEHFETMHRKEIVSTEKSTTGKPAPTASESVCNVPAPSAEGDSITSANSSSVDDSVPSTNSSTVVKIPYQTAIHEKNQKDAKLKNFEELKAPNDIVKMKEELKLKHFFKCMLWNCTFTTDNSSFFISHLSDNHSGKKLYCSFCFKEFASAAPLTNHMLLMHSKRCYQCSACFYRAFSKPHVQIHIKYNHSKETAVVFTSTTHLSNAIPQSEETEEEVGQTTWPYHCAIGECKFKTFDPKDFKKHNEITHRAVSVFICYYCKAEFISFKRLMNHYRLHGINNYQCTYCLHGSDTKDEILAHLSQNHADKPFQVHMRAPQEGPFGKDKTADVDCAKVGAADSNNNQNSVKSDAPVDRAQKKYGKQNKVAEPSEPVSIEPPVKKIKRESDDRPKKELIEKCPYEKVYPHHINDFESRFSCGIPTCEKQFEGMDLYLKHLQLNHIAMNIICPYCLDVSENEFDFKDHLWLHGPNLFACNDENCLYSHWKKEEVVDHVKGQHGGKGDSIITIRHKELNQSFVMKLPDISCPEEKKDLDNLQVGFLCPFCYYKSKSRVTMKKHIYKEFEYMRFRCTHCDTKFCSQKDIRLHFLSDHPNEDINAVLDLNAEVEHKVKAFLFCHQNTASTQVKNSCSANKKIDVTLYCPDCHKKFPRARDWHEHLKLCLIRQYDAKVLECVKCLVCSATYSELNLLKIHFSSAHCGKQLGFVEKPNRMDWMKETLLALRLQYVEHAIDGVIRLCPGNVLTDLLSWTTQCKLESKTYKCFYCSFTSSFKFNVERHLASSHSGKPIKIDRLTSRLVSFPGSKQAESNKSGEAAAYCCILCLKRFSSINNLRSHLGSSHSDYQTMKSYHLYAPSCESVLMEDMATFYECLYCSSGKKTFSEMKVHYEKYHPASEFKMKGSLVGGSKRKLSSDSANPEQPAKRIRKDDELLCCWHCSKSFLSIEELGVHCHIIHPGLPIKYEIQPVSDKSQVDQPSVCVSLSALGKDVDVDEPLPSSSKGLKSGKAKFNCTYCGAMFNSSYQMEKHITDLHAETHRKNKAYNLERITICLEHKDMGTIRLSAKYFSQTYNIFPHVEVTDILKK